MSISEWALLAQSDNQTQYIFSIFMNGVPKSISIKLIPKNIRLEQLKVCW